MEKGKKVEMAKFDFFSSVQSFNLFELKTNF
jgi:hypothetical protein